MTWTRALSTGSAALEFRLSIEGISPEWVTAAQMVGVSAGRTRRLGLQRDGIVLDEQGDLRECKLRLGSMTLKIADIDGYATAAFSYKPDKITYLTADMSTSDTTCTVASTDGGWLDTEQLYIGTETLDIETIDDATHFTVTRAFWD